MNQGGYGGQGGGWGIPPAGSAPGGGYQPAGPPPGGYGQPPGYGPPGGGYGGPPPNYGYGQQPPNPWGGPPNHTPNPEGFSRLIKASVVGGVVGGVLSAIPVLSMLNCCFCLLNMAGVSAGLAFHFRENPSDRVNNQDAAMMGAISGAIAGTISAIFNFIWALTIGTALMSLYGGWGMPSSSMRYWGGTTAGGMIDIIVRLPASMIVYGMFGALGGYLGMQLFFKDRISNV